MPRRADRRCRARIEAVGFRLGAAASERLTDGMTASMTALPPAASPRPSLSELFITFATISLYGFGGVLAWSRRMMVEERRWLPPEQFNEAYALCSFLPGPNIVNFSVIFGSRFRGPAGAMMALVGLLGPPMVLVTVVAMLYAHYGEIAALRRMLVGVS